MDDINENTETDAARISREMKTTVEAIAYIAEHMKAEMSDKKVGRASAHNLLLSSCITHTHSLFLNHLRNRKR